MWTSISCDHYNPVGSADIPAADTAEHPEFPGPLSLCVLVIDAIHPALWEGVVHETSAGMCLQLPLLSEIRVSIIDIGP